ncbi:MAG: malto-oligosyltrehalose trehalohydrolase [Verrucomicrobia bacterium]|nr:malto-oligosyltrehalose trehalohydrolase [Verrucomicrobiota bacterium]
MKNPMQGAATRQAVAGATPRDVAGVDYRVWALDHARVEVVVTNADDAASIARVVPLVRAADGWFEGTDAAGRVGDLYQFRLDGDPAQTFPDPLSRSQPRGVHGPSQVVAGGAAFAWEREATRPKIALHDLVIYELHVGTFTAAGTFRAAAEKLAYLAELGVTALELMPLADWPGRWNWGYDGVMLYAPASAYGTPDELRALIDAAHGHGLGVILDAVYNHLGPDGNYLGCYAKEYFNSKHKTPWGDGFNFDGPQCAAVREFFGQNAGYWMDEFHFDGFRLDAVHAIQDDSPRHILAEMAASIHARGGFVFAEDERNEAQLATPADKGGLGLDGLWADDFHHSVRVALTSQRESYLRDFMGSSAELADTLAHGWHYRGQESFNQKKPRGTECRQLPPSAFCHCISNHDQVGNQAFGERLTASCSMKGYRAASLLLCLTPYTPLLFQGQEWAASTPFLYFTDHNAELGKLVTAGRRKEFKGFKAFSDEAAVARIPDPQAETTFRASKLKWDEREKSPHDAVLALYRAALALRKNEPALRARIDRARWEVGVLLGGAVALRFYADAGHGEGGVLLVVDLQGGCDAQLADEPLARLSTPGLRWQTVLASNAREFGGDGTETYAPATGALTFPQPATVVLKAVSRQAS